jgi:hypothetical protein
MTTRESRQQKERSIRQQTGVRVSLLVNDVLTVDKNLEGTETEIGTIFRPAAAFPFYWLRRSYIKSLQ